MWCDNLPRLWATLSQVTFSYKVVIINHTRMGKNIYVKNTTFRREKVGKIYFAG